MKFFRYGLACLAFASLVPISRASGKIRAIYSNVQTSDTSLIPGFGGTRFKPGTTTQFDRPYASPNGQYWVIRSFANLATTVDEIILTGAYADPSSGVLRVREGTAAPWNGAINLGVIRQQMGINDAGNFAFSTDTTANTSADDHVVRFVGAYEVMAIEGGSLPSSALGFGSTNDSVNILADNSVAFRSDFLVGSTSDEAVVILNAPSSGIVLTDTITGTPTGQLPPNQLVDGFSAGSVRFNADGTHWVASGDLAGSAATDIVSLYDFEVEGQEGTVLEASSFTSLITSMDTASGTKTISGSVYAFRGSNADTIDWVKVSGNVVAATNTPITSTTTEIWDDASFAANYFSNVVNSLGDYVVGGTTNADATTNAVLVFNGDIVIAREGDPIDLNGNGIFDDNCNIDVFNNDDGYLTNDLRYVFCADIQNDAGTNIGQALLVKQIGFQPLSYTIVEGTPFGGDVNSLCMVDEDRLFILNDENDLNARLDYTINVVDPAVDAFRFMAVTAATRDDLSIFLELKNQNTLQYELNASGSSSLSDSTFDVVIGSNDYVNPTTANVEGRIRWIPQQDLESADGWAESINLINIVPVF